MRDHRSSLCSGLAISCGHVALVSSAREKGRWCMVDMTSIVWVEEKELNMWVFFFFFWVIAELVMTWYFY